METKALELRVGTFLLIGLAIIAGLIITFGRVGERFKPSYDLAVNFPNASGLLKGSFVYYAGAPIGRVISHPQVIREGRAVKVEVKIYSDIKIREDSRWVIGTSGLLGDRFVDVQPLETSDAPFLKKDDEVEGTRATGLSDLAERAEPLLQSATRVAQEVQKILEKFNTEVLTPDTSKEMRDSFKEVKMVLTRLDDILGQAQRGKGPLSVLLNDQETAHNLESFILNLRKHGVLFYADDTDKAAAKAELKTEKSR